MIITDLSQILFSVLFSQIDPKKNKIDADLLRYITLNCFRSYDKFRREYGEMVIAVDNSSWRKEVFPYYKASRKKSRDASGINWDDVFSAFDVIKSDLREYFPYNLIEVQGAEADDVISSVARSSTNPVLIMSGDTDFVQLHTNLISQYDIVRKKKIQTKDPIAYLQEHIIEGDSGDGIPNILSSDDTFVIGKRQKPLTKKKRAFLLNTDINDYPSVEKRNFKRNEELIDLRNTPEKIRNEILYQLNNNVKKDKSKLFNYFFDRKMNKFIEDIQFF